MGTVARSLHFNHENYILYSQPHLSYFAPHLVVENHFCLDYNNDAEKSAV